MLSAIADRVRRAADAVEGAPWGPGRVLLIVASIIAIRHLAEIAGPGNPTFRGLAALVHYPLAYIAPFMALALTLALWSGRPPARLGRLMTVAWLLTLIPPLADMVLHAGEQIPTIAYMQATPQDLPRVFLRFLDPTVSLVGTTAGIRVEAALAVLLGAAYVLLRRRGALRALGCAVSVYVVSMFFFTLPVLVLAGLRMIKPDMTKDDLRVGVGVFIRPDGETAFDSVAVLWLAPLLLLIGAIWERAERRFEDRWFHVSRGPSAIGGARWVAMGGLAAGILSALALFIPPPTPWLISAYDMLAIPGVFLCTWMITWAIDRPQRSGAAAAGVGLLGGCVLAALGTPVALGVLALSAPLSVPGLEFVRSRRGPWEPAARFVATALTAAGGLAAGFALVIGREGIARVPHAMWPSALLAGAAGTALVARTIPLWARIPVAVLLSGLAAAVMGSLAGAGFAACITLGAGLLLAAVERGAEKAPSYLAWTRGVVALAVLVPVVLPAFHQNTAPRLREEVRCNARLERLRAERLVHEGNLERAKSAYNEALRCDPEDVAALKGLGLLFARQENMRKTERYLMRALEHAPDDAELLANIGAMRLAQDRSEEALEFSQKALQSDPRQVSAMTNRAQALEDLGRTLEAIGAWKAVIGRCEGHPELAEAHARAQRRVTRLERNLEER